MTTHDASTSVHTRQRKAQQRDTATANEFLAARGTRHAKNRPTVARQISNTSHMQGKVPEEGLYYGSTRIFDN